MNKERLKEIMLDQNEAFNNKHHLIEREIDITQYIRTEQVVIISGIRRCGKSSLLYLLKERMRLEEGDYCYFNFDDERIQNDITVLDTLYHLHIELYGKEPVLFFDEIQNINQWEKFINRIYEKGIKIFITGSNARLLSSEISTSLTGRNKIIELFPFSFSEYLRFKGNQVQLNRLTSKQKAIVKKEFNQYFGHGGFPLVVKENDLELINSYFQDILYRDIISRYRISQIHEIKEIALYFATNIGRVFSYSTLQTISGIKSLSSIKDYLDYYEQSYLFFYLKKFDFSIKKQIMNPKKVYSIDPAISHRLGFNFSENRGRILENIVYLELRRRGKEVFYYTGKNECDFLIKEGLKIVEAIQVCYILEPTNTEREIKGLEEAMQVYDIKKGTIITFSIDQTSLLSKKPIEVVEVWNWLLDKSVSV